MTESATRENRNTVSALALVLKTKREREREREMGAGDIKKEVDLHSFSTLLKKYVK